MRRGSTSNVGPATKKLISTSSIDSVNAKSHPATTAGMTKKQEVKEPKKSFGGALGSMIAGGSYGLGMADMFTGSEATKAMWGGVKGALGGGGEEAAGGIGGAAGAIGSTLPETIGGGALSLANGGTAGGAAASLAAAESMANAGGAAAVSGATTAATEAAGAASAAGPVGWGLLAAGALAGLASYYL